MGYNVKFYSANRITALCTFAFTSASVALATYLYDSRRTPQLVSVGSSDIIDEVYEITFATRQWMSAIQLVNHNFKLYTIQYEATLGSGYVDFSVPISVSGNTATSNFHEFGSVQVNSIKLTVSTTQTANAQKKIGELRAMSLTGEISKNPYDISFEYQEASKNLYASGKENIFVLFGVGAKIKMKFEGLTATDMTLLYGLKFGALPFHIYPNGGLSTRTERGMRVEDMFYVNMTNDWSPDPKNIVLGVGENISCTFEAVHQTT